MAVISAALVKELREKTGAGMMDCKSASARPTATWSRRSTGCARKACRRPRRSRAAWPPKGSSRSRSRGRRASSVEVNSETDFVARNADFQALARNIAITTALTTGTDDVEAIKAGAYPGGGTVSDALSNAIATVGENMTLRRAAVVSVTQGAIGQYVHNAVADGLGKIGVLVAIESTGDAAVLATLARQVAMHVASASPLALDASQLDPETVSREKAVLADKNAGKPPHVLEKIVESGLRTYYKEVCLIDQASFHPEHGGKTIAQAVKETEGKAGAPVSIKGFVRFALGEGVDKGETADFAAEVAAMRG